LVTVKSTPFNWPGLNCYAVSQKRKYLIQFSNSPIPFKQYFLIASSTSKILSTILLFYLLSPISLILVGFTPFGSGSKSQTTADPDYDLKLCTTLSGGWQLQINTVIVSLGGLDLQEALQELYRKFSSRTGGYRNFLVFRWIWSILTGSGSNF
jgi:hypothetical protein